jgi:hypothetical protein
MKRNLFILILPFLVGCAQTVNYKLTKSDRWTGPKIDAVVCVQPIVDCTLVTNMDWRPHTEHIGKDDWRTNYCGGYGQTNLTAQVTAMIIKHLSYSGLFTKVVSETNANADYFLSGKLADFQTHCQVNEKAENIQAVSDGFGLIGAIVGIASTSGMKSEIKTSVKLDDLKLKDSLNQILWQDSVNVSTDVITNFEEANDMLVFNRPNQALKDAVKEMIYRLGNSSLTNRTSKMSH